MIQNFKIWVRPNTICPFPVFFLLHGDCINASDWTDYTPRHWLADIHSQRPCLKLIKQILRALSPHSCINACVWFECAYGQPSDSPKGPAVVSERGWCGKINTGVREKFIPGRKGHSLAIRLAISKWSTHTNTVSSRNKKLPWNHSVLIHRTLFLLLFPLSTLSLTSSSCLCLARHSGFIGADEIYYRSLVKFGGGRGCQVYKMNWLSLVHLYGPSADNVWAERRWDMVETGEGSNTAITAQLISIGVTERISVTPSMFTQAGRESSSKKQAERTGEEYTAFTTSAAMFI